MPWWVIATKPSFERRAAADIAEHGLDTWLPFEAYEFKNSRMPRPEWRYKLTYRGYVFASIGDLDEAEAWHLVRSCEGVIRPLMCCGGSRIFHFTDNEFSQFAAGFSCPIVEHVEDAWRIGDSVRVTQGPFASFQSRITAVLRGDRLRADVDIFGRQTPVEFEASQLEKV